MVWRVVFFKYILYLFASYEQIEAVNQSC